MLSVKTQQTKSNILHVAELLFMKYGIKKVSIKEIADKAKISKMTFYRIFGNKEEVAVEVLKAISFRNLEKYKRIMNQAISFEDRIKELVLFKQDANKAISEEFVHDVYSTDFKLLKLEIQNLRNSSQAIFMDDLKKAKEEGYIRPDINLKLIAYMINDMDRKIKDEQFLVLFKDFREASDQLFKHFFIGILPNDSNDLNKTS